MKSDLPSLRLLVLITDIGIDRKIDRLLCELHLPVYYQFRGQGTAKTELLDICGMQGTARVITVTILPKQMVGTVFERLEKNFYIRKKGRGVAVTVPVTGMQESVMNLLKGEAAQPLQEYARREERHMNTEALHAMILVAVKEGYSDDVIDAAAKAGAKGGSVIRGRRRGSEATVQFLGISMQEEQELVMIVAPRAKKSQIMNEIGKVCGLNSQAQGVIWSVPVDEVIGIHEE